MVMYQNQKVGFVWIPRLVLCWKLQSVTIKENAELRSESIHYPKTDLARGSGSLTDSTDSSETWRRNYESVKISRTLQLARRNPLQNRDRNRYQLHPHLPLQWPYRFTWENGSMSNLEHKIPEAMKLRRRGTRNFDTILFLQKKMVRLSPGDWKLEFASHFSTSPHWSIRSWKVTWKGAEVTRKDFSIVLIFMAMQFSTFEQSKVTQEEIRLIHLCRTMWWSPTTSSSTSITLKILTTCTPSSLQDWSKRKRVTDGILHSRGSHGSASSRAKRVRPDQAQNCFLQAKVESASECGVLD